MIYAFDLDSTLTKEETLPFLAKRLNLEMEYKKISEDIKNLSYNEGLEKRFSLFKDYSANDISKLLSTIPVFEKLMDFIIKNRKKSYIVTSNLDIYAKELCDKFGCEIYSSRFIDGNMIFIDKAKIINLLKQKDQVVFTGDGANDAEALKIADFSFAASYAHKAAKEAVEAANAEMFSEEDLVERLNGL